jgi:hypothetical protein
LKEAKDMVEGAPATVKEAALRGVVVVLFHSSEYVTGPLPFGVVVPEREAHEGANPGGRETKRWR